MGLVFLGADTSNYEEAQTNIIGIPYDGTSSYRSGARFAPNAIRIASDNLETFSPYTTGDIEEIKLADYGNIEISITSPEVVCDGIYNTLKDIVKAGNKHVFIGGEHTISIPVIRLMKEIYGDIRVIVFDAHADLRESYLGEKFCHATASRRIGEIVGFENLSLIGTRSFTKNEFYFARQNNLLYSIKDIIKSPIKKNTYISFDMDIFDPAIAGGVSTPEPGGIFFDDIIPIIKWINDNSNNIIGFDIVEVCPDYDPTQSTIMLGAKLIREFVLAIVHSS